MALQAAEAGLSVTDNAMHVLRLRLGKPVACCPSTGLQRIAVSHGVAAHKVVAPCLAANLTAAGGAGDAHML